MVKKDIRGRLFYAIYSSAKANNTYMKNYNKNKESSYAKYWNIKNFHGSIMS